MSQTFDPAAPRVAVTVEVAGPARMHNFRFALDTGATRTVIRPTFLQLLGYDPTAASGTVRLRSATGGGGARAVTVIRCSTLGLTRTNFPVMAHELPPAVTVDGLLGLDFFRGHLLTIDFARGRIGLRPPDRPWWRFWG